MKPTLLSLAPVLFTTVALCDDAVIKRSDFQSEAAKQAVKTFDDRVSFLEESMQQHLESATEQLNDGLRDALKDAAQQGNLKETERISKYLQADRPYQNEERVFAAQARIKQLQDEIATLKKQLQDASAADPLVGTWRYQQGNVCEFTSDGWIVRRGQRIAVWKRTGKDSYVAAFLKVFANGVSDDMILSQDGNTISAKSKSGKRFSIVRLNKK
ncbi:MAG: hypothetical protein AAF745_00955 [Planctomycetota bacterium]